MNRGEQRKLVVDLTNNLQELMLARLPRVPSHWDGHELRQWMADLAREEFNYRSLDRNRAKDYRNDRYNNNL